VGYGLRNRANLLAAGNSPASTTWLGATPNIFNSPATSNLVLKPAYGGGSINAAVSFIPYGVTPSTTAAQLGAMLRSNAGQVNLDPPFTNQIRNGLWADIGTSPRQKSFMMTFRREMTDNLEFNAEYSYNADKNVRNMSISTSLTVPATVPTNPFTSQVTVMVPMTQSTPVTSSNSTRRLTAGLIWRLPADWTLQADYTRTAARNVYMSYTNLATADITAAMTAGTINPFVDTTLFPIDLTQYLGTANWNGLGTMNDISLRAAGPVWTLPGGDITLAAGLQRRQDGYKDAFLKSVYANFPARDTMTQAFGKKAITKSAYLEAYVPIIGETNRLPFVYELGLQLAGRLEDFKVGTGTTSAAIIPAPNPPVVVNSNSATYESSNPTIAVSYKPVNGLIVRASYGEGFVPPSFANLAMPTPALNLTSVTDPRRGNSPVSVATFTGGNPNLSPEVSSTWNAGIVFEPQRGWAKGFRLSADYLLIEKRDNISSLTAQLMIDNEASFPDRVIRGPVPPNDPFGVGPITSVNLGSVNIFRAFYESVDISIRYRRPTANWGTFEFTALGTIGLQQKSRLLATLPFVDNVGFTGRMHEHNGTGTLIWDYRRWSVGWSGRYVPKMKVSQPPITTSLLTLQGQGSPYVPFQDYHDVFASYRFPITAPEPEPGVWGQVKTLPTRLLSGCEVQVGVNNVFKRIPPYDASTFVSYMYSTYGDIRLRDVRISVKKPF
jgi:iron complex outermembrane recepter protein